MERSISKVSINFEHYEFYSFDEGSIVERNDDDYKKICELHELKIIFNHLDKTLGKWKIEDDELFYERKE